MNEDNNCEICGTELQPCGVSSLESRWDWSKIDSKCPHCNLFYANGEPVAVERNGVIKYMEDDYAN